MEAENPAEQFALSEVPASLHSLIPSALRRAYAAADATMEMNPYLQTPGAKYQRGDLVALAADHEFEKLIKTGKLPFEPKWEWYARPTGKHFVMLSKLARITLAQIGDPDLKPRYAEYRRIYGVPNMRFLFEHMNREVEQEKERRLIHVLHGYGQLQFAHLTVPHPRKNEHVWRSRNLLNIPHEVVGDLPKAEGPAESPDPEAVEQLERVIRDDD